MNEIKLEIMAVIQAEKEREITDGELQPLDPEGIAMARDKRATFDLPVNVAKTDPLR